MKNSWMVFGITVIIGIVGVIWFGQAKTFGRVWSFVAGSSALREENQVLKREVETLRAQLIGSSLQPLSASVTLTAAKVFSFYPLNIKNKIFITAGDDRGVMVGDGVLFAPGVFLGTISRTAREASEVITMFDSSFSVPVRIGAKQVDGLLQGGLTPRITLIDKNKAVAAGDEVYTTAHSFPYGLRVGTIETVEDDSSNAFFEARITPPYVLSDVRDVWIVKKTNL